MTGGPAVYLHTNLFHAIHQISAGLKCFQALMCISDERHVNNKIV